MKTPSQYEFEKFILKLKIMLDNQDVLLYNCSIETTKRESNERDA